MTALKCEGCGKFQAKGLAGLTQHEKVCKEYLNHVNTMNTTREYLRSQNTGGRSYKRRRLGLSGVDNSHHDSDLVEADSQQLPVGLVPAPPETIDQVWTCHYHFKMQNKRRYNLLGSCKWLVCPTGTWRSDRWSDSEQIQAA